MRHVSVVTLKSELDEYKDEVTFTIRKVSHGLRMKVRNQLTQSVEQIQKLTEDLFAIPELVAANKAADDKGEPAVGLKTDGIKLIDESEDTAASQDELEALTRAAYKATWIREKVDAIQKSNVDPVYLKECLVSVRGIKYSKKDGPLDSEIPVIEQEDCDFEAASLLEYGPEDLCKEIIEKIKLEFGITPLQAVDLELGSISGAVEDGAKNTSSADTAEKGDSTKPETAKSTTQN